MNHRERFLAVMNYERYDRLPIIHFGFWRETVEKWIAEGHIKGSLGEELSALGGSDFQPLSEPLGFDYGYNRCNIGCASRLSPAFEPRRIKGFPDGSYHALSGEGVVELHIPGTQGIPAEVDHLLKDRDSWEEHYLHRLQWKDERLTGVCITGNDGVARKWDEGGRELFLEMTPEYPVGMMAGSLYGQIRNYLGLEGSCYLQADDEDLFDEIIDTVGEMNYRGVEAIFKSGAKVDYLHFWEDICFKSGPLISPSVFAEKVGPHYKRITELAAAYGVNLTSLDCDGKIDALLPIWLENDVNIMFPIEVGTWEASIGPWKEQYGQKLRGVGGMNKNVFARDRAAIEAEVERLKPLVELGGYIPCPDHRIAPDSKWDLVCYYTELMRKTFG